MSSSAPVATDVSNPSSLPVKLDTGVWLIIVFKAVVGLFWLCVAVGAFRVMDADLQDLATRLVEAFNLDPDTHLIRNGLAALASVRPSGLRALMLASFSYGSLEIVQAVGLYFRKVWADWLIIVATILLIPVELFEIVKHATPAKFALLALNILIVVYLWKRHIHKPAH